MKDVSPELLKSIMDDFEKDLDSSSVRKQLLKVIEEGTATYKEVNEYAIEVGEILAKAFQNNLSSEVLPEGHMYYNIAQKVVAEPMKNNYKLVSKACADVQTSLNRSVGLGLNGATPDLNQDRIQGILNLISGKDQFDDIKYMLDEPVVNFTQSVVDDTIKKNAEKQYLSGLSPKIKRTSTGKCCKWCDRLVGTYDYATVRSTGNDVFRRHKHCRCTVEFITNGKRQNVHTKKWYKADKEVLEKRKNFKGIDTSKRVQEVVEKNEESGRLKLKDIVIGRSVGAQFKKYNVRELETGEIFHFVEGTRIQDVEVFAGKGTKHPLHEGVAEGLSNQIGGKPEEWQHCKGTGTIDYYGEERKAEVHWFQEKSVGKCKFKIKRWRDES